MPLSEDPKKREAQLANLQPGNSPGRPVGSKSWSTVVKQLLEDEELFNQLLASMERKPKWLETTSTKSLMQAITIAQSLKALGGSHFSAEWVRKTGYGDKIDITSNGETITAQPIIISNIRARNVIEGQVVPPAETESTDESSTSPETTVSS